MDNALYLMQQKAAAFDYSEFDELALLNKQQLSEQQARRQDRLLRAIEPAPVARVIRLDEATMQLYLVQDSLGNQFLARSETTGAIATGSLVSFYRPASGIAIITAMPT